MNDLDVLVAPYSVPSQRFTDQLVTLVLEQNARLTDARIYDGLLLELVRGFVEAERQLQDLNKLKDRFIGMAAHDLRNPLAAIRGYSELLLTGELDEEMKQEFLQSIHQVSHQMLGLVNDLLDVSVIESGHLQLRLEAVDLSDLLRGRVALVGVAASVKGISLAVEAPPAVVIQGDRDRLSQVVDNLLTNAVKFSPGHTQVVARVYQEGKKACLEVTDQGPGMQPEDMDRLFGAFQKLSALPTSGEKSTGLGLSIVKKIVDAHGGTITARNNPEVGCTFLLVLG